MFFIEYIVKLINGIPDEAYIISMVFYCAGTVMLLGLNGLQKGLHYSMRLLLVDYFFIVYSSTVFYREKSDKCYYNYSPFWSYDILQETPNSILLYENLMNVVVFVPVGFLLGFSFLSMKWWKVLLIGSGVSISIETLQYFFHRGFSEVDDVIHNTIGCLIGYGVYSLLKKGYETISKRRLAVF